MTTPQYIYLYSLCNNLVVSLFLFYYPFTTLQGRNVLFHCVDCDIHTDIIEEILQRCSAEIVTLNQSTSRGFQLTYAGISGMYCSILITPSVSANLS
jgi:hypothetical protein